MALFTVFARRDDPLPEIVPEKFSWFAALLPPVYGLVHGLWLGLVAYVGLLVLVAGIAMAAGGDAARLAYCVLAVLIGFEAPAWRAQKLRRKGYEAEGAVVATDADHAMVEFLRGRPA
ncbi:DUF2628 domain-containing protein [Arsenicitalea aurantiaca]|uniref:DUF2628 domain-containing protein n=1 Tax=Arsenicitalea aurantiaca TaxID=1783274 RepID=A0A433X7X3_9HYPH|nr:DUF2628 domain-containing protein [Arsenicitalea aurantiaca]RUT30159.1 DUF2628 domain-containing protein [Arsenicitalea aurantiaca]